MARYAPRFPVILLTVLLPGLGEITGKLPYEKGIRLGYQMFTVQDCLDDHTFPSGPRPIICNMDSCAPASIPNRQDLVSWWETGVNMLS